MAKKESKSTFEREYTIPLRKGFRQIVSHKKTPRAVREIFAYLKRHTKAENIKLGMHLNEHLWQHGSKNPPAKVKVHVVVKDGVATAELVGKTFKEAVKSQDKKKEPQNLKEKIEAKLGADDKPKDKETAKEAPAKKKKAPAKKE